MDAHQYWIDAANILADRAEHLALSGELDVDTMHALQQACYEVCELDADSARRLVARSGDMLVAALNRPNIFNREVDA